MKRLTAAFLVFALFLHTAPVLTASAAGEVIIPVYLDGTRIDFGYTNNKQDNAIILHDYAYVPIAQIIEILTGSRPVWDPEARTSSFTFNGKRYVIDTEKNGIYVDGKFVPSVTGTPPAIVNDRMLIPLKMLSSVMGFGQVWNESTRSTYLTSPVIQTKPPVVAPPAVTPVPPIAALPPMINSAEINKTSIITGESVNIVVKASMTTTTVKVVDSANRTLKESKAYRPGDNERIFELDFAPSQSGTYYIYAGDNANYEPTGFKSVTVTVGAASVPVIYGASFDKPEVAIDLSVGLTVVTSANVVSLDYSITSGGGRLASFSQTNGTADGADRKVFTNIYYAPGVTGEVRIVITATTSSGQTQTQTITGNIVKSAAVDIAIYGKMFVPQQKDKYTANEIVTIEVTTGKDTMMLTVQYGGIRYQGTLQSESSDRKYWIVSFPAAAVTQSASIESTYLGTVNQPVQQTVVDNSLSITIIGPTPKT